jgi:hypothetical protein
MKKIKNLLLGGEEEKKAAKTLEDLKGRDDATLSYSERDQRSDASTKILKLRARQGLSALAAVGLAVGAYYKTEDKELPEKPEIVHASEVEIQRKFTVGPFEFVKTSELSDKEFDRIERILTAAYPEYQKYLPMEGVAQKQIKVSKSLDGKTNLASYSQASVKFTSEASDGLMLHELVHLLHGDNDLYYDFVEEGVATAISILTTDALKMESWDRTASFQPNETLEDSLALNPGVSYAANPELRTIRYEKAAYFWIEMEKNKAGSIKAFHEAYYAYLKNGGKKEDLLNPSVFKQILSDAALLEDFEEISKKHSIVQIAKDEMPDLSPKLFVYYMHHSDDDRRQLIVSVAKRNEKGGEGLLQQIRAEFEIENLDTGKKSQKFVSKLTSGKVVIDLYNPYSGKKFLEDSAGVGKHYRVLLHVPTPGGVMSETFEFDYL